MQQVSDVLSRVYAAPIAELPAPAHLLREGPKVMLAVESMARHTTDEGWQLSLALQSAGYTLVGYKCDWDTVDVEDVLREKPSVVVVQDKREWDPTPGNFREPLARFKNVGSLKDCGATVLTVLKDAQQNPPYHRESADEIGAHAWITYYHSDIVKHVAKYVRKQHLVRTYHSLDVKVVPPYDHKNRSGALLSGAISNAYPMRRKLLGSLSVIPGLVHHQHPGYHRNGCATPAYLKMLTKFKVAVCTSSVYGYALRKIIEATAAGCMVLTDLPIDEAMPHIDGNLTRVRPNEAPTNVAHILRMMYDTYNPEIQWEYSKRAVAEYNYMTLGQQLNENIEKLRCNYVP